MPSTSTATMPGKQLSNPASMGGAGAHFESHVQASYVALMLSGGYAPCLPCWPIHKIKLQGKIAGFETDDLIVWVKNPACGEECKLLGQVKRTVRITARNEKFREFIAAAWRDFNNPKLFNRGKDALALITNGLGEEIATSVAWLCNQARHTLDPAEFFRNVEQAKFSSDAKRAKLKAIRAQLKKAKGGLDASPQELYEFLAHFRLIPYDLGTEEGVVLSLLHSHLSQFESERPDWLWGRIVDIVQTWNQDAGTITPAKLPLDLRQAFVTRAQIGLPREIGDVIPPLADALRLTQVPAETVPAFLLGGWRESNPADLEVVAELAQTSYADWVLIIRELIDDTSLPLVLRNGTWLTSAREEDWKQIGPKVFDQELARFREAARQVLAEVDPAFDMSPEERYMARVQGKVPKYSETLRKGIANTLAVLGSRPELFTHCSRGRTEETAIRVVREVLGKADFKLWGTLNNHLPLLAEAAPDEFLDAVENARLREPCPFTPLFDQEGRGIIGSNYLTGLWWALEALAWDPRLLTRVTVLLGELDAMDPGGNWSNRPGHSLATIFLPWHPQTTAPIEKRAVALRNLVKEVPETGWSTLLNLLPKQHQMTSGTYKPKWRALIPPDWKEGVTGEEYWTQILGYADMAIDLAEEDCAKIETLIRRLDSMPEPAFNRVLELLQSEGVLSRCEEEKTRLWSALTDLSLKHRKYAEAKWALGEQVLAQVDEVASLLRPQSPFNLHQRIFVEHGVHDLYEEKANRDDQQRKLEQRREAAIREIYEIGGIEWVKQFAAVTEAPRTVGTALGGIGGMEEDRELLPNLLVSEDSGLREFASSYVWTRRWASGWEWVDDTASEDWSLEQIVALLTSLPFCKEAWDRAERFLGGNQSMYWERVFVDSRQAQDHLDEAVDKLLEFKRPYAAIDCLDTGRFLKMPLDHGRTVRALLDAVSSEETPSQMARYCITGLIQALQEDKQTNPDDLFRVEWAYLELLDGHAGVRPKHLEERLASDPSFFCDLIRRIFRSTRNGNKKRELPEADRKIASRAYRLLDAWKSPPGTQPDGSFSPELFTAWLAKVRSECAESGHLEVALSRVGQSMLPFPPDPDGFWIHPVVAQALNAADAGAMRDGLRTGIFNSRGVHEIDPRGTPEKRLAQEFAQRAEESENAGYHRLAATMRDLEGWYLREAQRIADEYGREQEGIEDE